MSYTDPKPRTKVLALDEIEPPYDEPSKCPKTLTKSRRIDNVFYVAGKAPTRHEKTDDVTSEIMFVATVVEEEEAQELTVTAYGQTIKQKADYGRGPAGNLFREVASRSGLFHDEHYHTALVKWLLPKSKRSSPNTATMKWGMPVLLDEIERVKPKIIVCLGKKVFDQLSDRKLNFKDAHGGWFWSTKAKAHIYLMQTPYMLVAKPELFEMFRVDLTEIARKLEILRHGPINEIPVNIQVIDNWRDLQTWAARMRAENHKLYSVDCEWHGRQHIDGQLRSIQFAWNESDVVYIRFRNENNEFCFKGIPEAENPINRFERDGTPLYQPAWDMDYDEAFASITQDKRDELKEYRKIGNVLAGITDPDDVKFVGHHYVADAVWMDRWLGMKVLGKVYMDTEFAQQTADESSELKLERGIAMKYTTLGRYDLDLVLWKKDNKKLCEGGYGYIPDDILIQYASKDVLAVMRAVPFIRKLLDAQRLWDYYENIFNPFVTDVFFTFTQTGLPMDIELMDELRELFNWSRRELEVEFRVRITEDAKQRLVGKCIELLGPDRGIIAGIQTANMISNGDVEQAWKELKNAIPLNKFVETKPFLDHCEAAPTFNLRSADHMRRWLFDVSGMTPIKTTNQKSKGMPSMDWQKVLELPADKQALYKPSVDKQTLLIISSQLPLAEHLLDLNVVGNLCKAFLKEPTSYWDEDLEEEVVEEAGLHQWVASDLTIRGQTSTTETGRPRGWAPNYLNWPSYVNKRIGKVIARLIQTRLLNGVGPDPGQLPETLRQWRHVKDENDLPSIRSVVRAVTGMCLVESDYKTAEIRGMAYISGDHNLMRLMNDKDPEWAFAKDDSKVRVAYTDFALSGIPKSKQNPEYILKKMEGGELIKQYTLDDMLRDEQTGELVHCSYDLHWSIAEWTYEIPREEMLDKVHRAAGKVLNFSCFPADACITTDSGPVRIDNISVGHLLWDGVEWVKHEGAQYQGMRGVISYGGTRATPEHVVYTACGRCITLVDAAIEGASIAITERGGALRSFPTLHAYDPETPEGIALACRVRELRSLFREVDSQLGGWQVNDVPLLQSEPEVLQRSSGEDAGCPLPRDGAALPQGYARIIAGLQRSRHRGADGTQGVRDLGLGDLAGGELQGAGLRPERQRRSLRDHQSPTGRPLNKPQEHAASRYVSFAGSAGDAQGLPGLDLRGEDYLEQTPEGAEQRADTRGLREVPASERLHTRQLLEEVGDAEVHGGTPGYKVLREICGADDSRERGYRESLALPQGAGDQQHQRTGAEVLGITSGSEAESDLRQAASFERRDGVGYSKEAAGTQAIAFCGLMPVWDIINAGPRHRFTADGNLVSNSAYGASPGSLERKIESDTGVKPAEGTGQKGLDAIAARQPRATEFLEEMQNVPATKGSYRAASGRIRHCVIHDRSSGVSYRTRNSIASATGRELRNFPFQESVASTAALAGKWLGAFFRNTSMKARVITILYDSVVTMCPFEEREVVAHLHQQFMCDANNWVYDDDHGVRELTYPIDTDFNYRWSTKPTKAEKAELADMTWHPTPERLRWVLSYFPPKRVPFDESENTPSPVS